MMADFSATVGARGANRAADVAEVQRLLNLRASALGIGRLRSDGVIDAATHRAIARYQAHILRVPANGSISAGDATARALADQAPSTLLREKARGREASALLSGADWFRRNQARFPDSNRVMDLAPAFSSQVGRFLDALARAGAAVQIHATRRHRIRGWLMHHAAELARGAIGVADIPVEPEAGILWDHGDVATSRAAAGEMMRLFAARDRSSSASNGVAGTAIDMAITWPAPIEIRDAYGAQRPIDQPRNGTANAELHAVGASYGVFKLANDPTSWSVDGR